MGNSLIKSANYTDSFAENNLTKAELLQLNRTLFSPIVKKVGNQKDTKTTFIISVLKVVYTWWS